MFQNERKKLRKIHVYKKYHIWNPSACVCESNRYSKSIIDDLVITYDEIIDTVANSYDDVSYTSII